MSVVGGWGWVEVSSAVKIQNVSARWFEKLQPDMTYAYKDQISSSLFICHRILVRDEQRSA